MNKVFVVDNKIIEEDSSTPKKIFLSAIIDIAILEIISLIFMIVLETIINYKNSTLITLITIFPVFFVLSKFFLNFCSTSFSRGVIANQIPYVILYDNKMLVINNIGVVEPAIAITYGKQLINGNNLVEALVDVGFSVAGHDIIGNDLSKGIDISVVENIINNEIAGFYNITTYENVSFIKETKNHYYFKGNLLDRNGKIKGEKQFALMKIYDNYEELKMVK